APARQRFDVASLSFGPPLEPAIPSNPWPANLLPFSLREKPARCLSFGWEQKGCSRLERDPLRCSPVGADTQGVVLGAPCALGGRNCRAVRIPSCGVRGGSCDS